MITVHFSMPPASNLGWPGIHRVNLDHNGGYQTWHSIQIQGTGWPYVIHVTPWQLIALAAALLYLRARRWVRRRLPYKIHQVAPDTFNPLEGNHHVSSLDRC